MEEQEESWCRHCAQEKTMTAEHLPQRSVGNSGETSAYVHLPSRSYSGPIGTWHDGHSVPTLCEPCNRRASDLGYVGEFRLWHELVVRGLREYVAIHNVDPTTARSFSIELPYDRMPGRFVRQVIGNLLAMQMSPQLIDSYPILAELIGPDPSKPDREHQPLDISPLRLLMGIANRTTLMNTAPIAVMVSEVDLQAQSQQVGAVTTLAGMAVTYVVSPFAFVLSDCPVPGVEELRIDEWTKIGIHDRLPKRGRLLDIPTLLSGWTGRIAAAMNGVDEDVAR